MATQTAIPVATETYIVVVERIFDKRPRSNSDISSPFELNHYDFYGFSTLELAEAFQQNYIKAHDFDWKKARPGCPHSWSCCNFCSHKYKKAHACYSTKDTKNYAILGWNYLHKCKFDREAIYILKRNVPETTNKTVGVFYIHCEEKPRSRIFINPKEGHIFQKGFASTPGMPRRGQCGNNYSLKEVEIQYPETWPSDVMEVRYLQDWPSNVISIGFSKGLCMDKVKENDTHFTMLVR